MKITEFTATAEILGKTREVRVRMEEHHDGEKYVKVPVFQIEGMTADEGQIAVQALSRISYQKVEVTGPDPDRFIGGMTEAVKEEPETKKEPGRRGRKPAEPKVDTPVEAVKVEEAPAIATPEPEPERKAAPSPEVKEEPKAETPKTKGKKAAPAAAMELPDNIKTTGSMKELLTYMVEQGGVKNADDLVAQCTALREVVPVLTKVPDVDARVRRAVEVLGLFASDEAEAAAAN